MDLDLIRRRHKWLTLIILFFIGAVFIFGMGSFVTDFGSFSSGSGGTAAEVNGQEISLSEYVRARNNMRREYGDREGGLPQAAVDFINVSALNQLIDLKLLSQKSKELGFRVTDEEIAQVIRSVFQIDGQFVGTERYQSIVQESMNEDIGAYEQSVKEQLLAQKLGRLIEETIMVTDEKLLNMYNLQNEKINLNYIEFSNADISDIEEPTEQEIDRYYQSKKADFKTTELREIRYIILEPETFENGVQVSQEELNAYYNAYPEEFQSEEGATLSFEEAKGDVESNLRSQRAELNRTEFLDNFGLSQGAQSSIDQIAKDKGIEAVSKSSAFAQTQRTGDIPPQVVDRTYSIDEGSLAVVPIGTSIWVVEVSDVSEPREKTLEEIKPEIIAAVKNQKSKNQARTKANQALAKLRSAKNDEISEKAKELGASLEETGPFTRVDRVPSINLEEIKSEAFDIDKKGTVLSRVYESNNSFYVLIFKEKINADPLDFETQKEELREQELQAQRNKVLEKWLQNLRREANIAPNYEIFPSQG